MALSFANRIKKEMTECIVRALLEDAGYRVIDSGIEKVIRELSCMPVLEYKGLSYPKALSLLPDFTVMDREQKTKFLVEVKYRKVWGEDIFQEVKEQVRLYGELVLISFNARAPDEKNYKSPLRFLRCCRLRFEGDEYQVQYRSNGNGKGNGVVAFKSVAGLENTDQWLWWSMLSLPEVFTQLNEKANEKTLFQAVNALAGILETQ